MILGCNQGVVVKRRRRNCFNEILKEFIKMKINYVKHFRFSTINPWKFNRHTLSKRHLGNVNKVTMESEGADNSAEFVNQLGDHADQSADFANGTADHTNKTADATIELDGNFEEKCKNIRDYGNDNSQSKEEIAVNGFVTLKDTHENDFANDSTAIKQEQNLSKTQPLCDNERKEYNERRKEDFSTGMFDFLYFYLCL